ncbi:hypothetical protein GCM10010210_16610 [Pseudonocardia hydrocarbonoxydans]|uniref:Uncharacterized protein n=1 Tax=Pseudonocardia hydrocarbonoxydans TaxID=76726 RepID=A0A4Y3WXQ3_9PSEU|nr:hypothetical protein PHY01_45090 [Pseudonocardia hydrocarbonoxydans]
MSGASRWEDALAAPAGTSARAVAATAVPATIIAVPARRLRGVWDIFHPFPSTGWESGPGDGACAPDSSWTTRNGSTTGQRPLRFGGCDPIRLFAGEIVK